MFTSLWVFIREVNINMCMYEYIYIVHKHINMYIYINIRMSTHEHASTSKYICMFTSVWIFSWIPWLENIYVYMYIYIYIFVYIQFVPHKMWVRRFNNNQCWRERFTNDESIMEVSWFRIYEWVICLCTIYIYI